MEAMQQPNDALIVEAYPIHEPRFAGITVYYATQVTTKALQAAKRTEQAAPVNGE